MKVIVGHKILNLEEILQVALYPNLSEVVVDNQIYNELSKEKCKAPKEQQTLPVSATFLPHKRSTYLVMLVQILKLKKNTSQQTVDFIVNQLNSDKSEEEGGPLFTDFFAKAFAAEL